MSKDYCFIYNYEPSDEQLQALMKEFSVRVKERAKNAEEKFIEELKIIIETTLNKGKKNN